MVLNTSLTKELLLDSKAMKRYFLSLRYKL
jgi:hypothetical protein